MIERRELLPGIIHDNEVIHLRHEWHNPLSANNEREIVVDPQRYPFEAGETPYRYACRIVALLDAGAVATRVEIVAEASVRGTAARPEGVVTEESIMVRYRTSGG